MTGETKGGRFLVSERYVIFSIFLRRQDCVILVLLDMKGLRGFGRD